MECRMLLLPVIFFLLGSCKGEDGSGSPLPSPSPSPDLGTAPPYESGEPEGPSLGFIIGVATIIVTILYIIGICFKVFKIFRGEYEPSEPVYLKYK